MVQLIDHRLEVLIMRLIGSELKLPESTRKLLEPLLRKVLIRAIEIWEDNGLAIGSGYYLDALQMRTLMSKLEREPDPEKAFDLLAYSVLPRDVLTHPDILPLFRKNLREILFDKAMLGLGESIYKGRVSLLDGDLGVDISTNLQTTAAGYLLRTSLSRWMQNKVPDNAELFGDVVWDLTTDKILLTLENTNHKRLTTIFCKNVEI